jgi:hypothetical protein
VRAVSVDVAKKKAEKKFDGFYVYIIREIIDLLDVIK